VLFFKKILFFYQHLKKIMHAIFCCFYGASKFYYFGKNSEIISTMDCFNSQILLFLYYNIFLVVEIYYYKVSTKYFINYYYIIHTFF
jgi:hypothetical protein